MLSLINSNPVVGALVHLTSLSPQFVYVRLASYAALSRFGALPREPHCVLFKFSYRYETFKGHVRRSECRTVDDRRKKHRRPAATAETRSHQFRPCDVTRAMNNIRRSRPSSLIIVFRNSIIDSVECSFLRHTTCY